MNQEYEGVDTLKGLLVLAPFFLSITSLLIGLKIGVFTLVFVVLLAPILFFSRNLFALQQQRLVFVLIISVSWLLIMRMFLHAEAYILADKIDLFFPLLLINCFVLSINASILAMPNFKSVINRIFKVGLAILLFFIIFGFLHELLSGIPVFTSPGGFFFISGFLFAVANFYNRKKLNFLK